MDEAITRLRIQLALRPGPWIAVVHGQPAAAVRQAIATLGIRPVEGPPGPDEVAVRAVDRVPDTLREPPMPLPGAADTGRFVMILPREAEDLPAPPWLACRIGGSRPPRAPLPPPLQAEPRGSSVDPLPLLQAGLPTLALGIEALLDRGWFEDAGYFLERLRFLTYRAASTTWDDRDALLAVAEAEELTGRMATGLGAYDAAWEAWRTAWWVRGELVRDDADRALVERASKHIEALDALR